MRFLTLMAMMTSSAVAAALSDPVSQYAALRRTLIKSEESIALGASLQSTFTEDERAADRVIRGAKARALSPVQPDGGPPIASQHFFDAKPRMESTDLFPMLRSMPKGAVLHTHPDALQDVAWVVQHATYDDRLWVCGDIGTGQLDNPLQFQFSASPGGPSVPWNSYVAAQTVNCTWRNVVVLRNESGNARAFDQLLLEDLTLITSRRPAYASQKDVWTKFQNCFGRIAGIYYFDGFHQALMEAAFRAMHDDGVQHLELRQMLSPGGIYSLNGTVQPIDATLESLVAAANSTGITLRVQLAEMRAAEPALVETGIQETARLMAKYPELIVGFDLVGQEDAGRPLADFLPELLQQNEGAGSGSISDGELTKVPYFFHAGETDEVGLSPDLNLFDAVLLNSTRIGHGYSLSRHPELRQLVSQKGIAIEVCPLSNQLLMLVNDLRDHPAPSQWAADGNIPITINPDDPALWGAVAVSYDWFQFFLSTGNSTGLGLLKQLALNSWKYSALSRAEAASGQTAWEERWAAWAAALALAEAK